MLGTCPSCLGKKQVMKIGMVYGDCDTCSGKGKVSQTSVVDAALRPIETKVHVKPEPEPEKIEPVEIKPIKQKDEKNVRKKFK